MPAGRTKLFLPLLLLCFAPDASPQNAEDRILEGLRLEKVEGDLPGAIELYKSALQDRSLDAARQAEVRLRLAVCLWDLGEPRQAKPLAEAALNGDVLPPKLRRRAHALLKDIKRNAPPPASAGPSRPAFDPAEAQRKVAQELLAEARRLREQGDEAGALLQVRLALRLHSKNADAQALRLDLENRLSEETRFVNDVLEVLNAWTEAETKAVRQRAFEFFDQARRAGKRSRLNQAETLYQKAISAIDESEFGNESDDLVDLRHRIEASWRDLRSKHMGPEQADPPIEERTRRPGLRADFVNLLRRMLGFAAAGDQEYRILTIRIGRASLRPRRPRGGHRLHLLWNRIPSGWTPSSFASLLVPARVEPESWAEPGNLIEAHGSSLVVRNRPAVLRALQAQIRRIRNPDPQPLSVRLLAGSVPHAAIESLEQRYGGLKPSTLGASPVLTRVFDPGTRLETLIELLNESGADLNLARDGIHAELANGAPQTLFLAAPLAAAEGYDIRKDPTRRLPVPDRKAFYGLLLDMYPLQDPGKPAALALRMRSRFPAAPLPLKEHGKRGERTLLHPRYLEQETAVFVELPAKGTLLVAGLVDPFAAARRETDADTSYVLLWELGGTPSTDPASSNRVSGGADATEDEAEVPMGELLLQVTDRPGPRFTEDRGFVTPDPLEVLRERATFFEELIRSLLDTREARIEPRKGVLYVPARLQDRAAAIIAALTEESRNAYEVRVRVRPVRINVRKRWLERELEGQALFRPFGEALVAYVDLDRGEFLLRNIPVTDPDLYAPREELAPFGTLGLQAHHVHSTRSRSFPQARSAEQLADGVTHTVTEGLRVSVRPFRWDDALFAILEVETAVLTETTEERVSALDLPSYRTSVTRFRAVGRVDLGPVGKLLTAVVANVPHPTASTPDRLTELLIAVTVRPVER